MPSENPFWDFSLAVYRKPGVADACLLLQDTAGVDVNVLLFVCWLGATRDAPMDETELRDVIARTADWRDRVVRPLRDVRRWMKGGAEGFPDEPVEALRSAIKRVELESERLQQDMLYSLAGGAVTGRPGGDSAAQRTAANALLYLRVIGAPRTVEVTQACHTVAAASISG